MGKRVEMRKSNRYTFMLVPERDGRAKIVSFSKGRIKFFSFCILVCLCFFGYSFFSSFKIKKENDSLKAQLDSFKNDKYGLHLKLESMEDVKNTLIKENENALLKNEEMKVQLQNMISLEEKLLKALENSDVSKKLKENSDFAFAEYVADFGVVLDNTEGLINRIEEEDKKLRKIPSMVPAKGYISSVFGRRVHPVYGTSKMHNGLDIANVKGTAIWATADGVVKEAGYTDGFGYLVVIDHENGYETYYAHNSKLLVKRGERVERGEKIALMGTTGTSTGTHCHFEVRYNGVPVNPSKYVKY